MMLNTEKPLQTDSATDRPVEFARLFSSNARRLYGFIMTLVLSHQDAEEVFQNASVVLWDKFLEFEPGTNFFAWASRVAYFEALRHMKQQRRSQVLSGVSLELLADEAVAISAKTSMRDEALEECLSKLAAADRQLVHDRYYGQRTPKQIADARGRSVGSIYRALSRIHSCLLLCMERSVAWEESR